MCRPSLLCSIELTLTMCTVEQKFETTRLAETFIETFGHLLIICCIASIPHASSIIGTGAVNGKPCSVIFWHHIYMARFCWATFVRNPVDHIVYSRTPLMRLSPAVACFTDGLVEAGDRMAFALFLFNIKNTSGWLSQNKLVSRLHPTALQINRLRVVNCVSVPCLAENRAQDHGQYNRFTTILFIALHIDPISGIC